MIRYIIFWCVMQSVQAPPSTDEYGRVSEYSANSTVVQSKRYQQVFTKEDLAKKFYLELRALEVKDSLSTKLQKIDSVSAIQIKDISWKP